jgi:ATP-dependent Clp protease adaptor protein ClpS
MAAAVEYRPVAESPSTYATPETIEEQGTGTGEGLEARVVVYNCNCHTYQQVIQLFCEFIPGMTPGKAFELAWKIDHQGSAVVFEGDQATAERIAKHLASGGLRVAVQ